MWFDRISGDIRKIDEKTVAYYNTPCNAVNYVLSERVELLSVLKDVTEYASRNHCSHEETYRGGVIWEICSMCGAKWADDEGGKPDDAGELPKCIKNAYDIISKYSKE